MCQRGSRYDGSVADPAEPPSWLLPRQADCFRQDAVPLPLELSPFSSRRMQYNGPLCVAESEAQRVGTPTPVDVFRDASTEPADALEYRLWHKEISRAREAVLLDVFFEVESKHRLDGLRRGHFSWLANFGDDLPPDIIKPLDG